MFKKVDDTFQGKFPLHSQTIIRLEVEQFYNINFHLSLKSWSKKEVFYNHTDYLF